jgi:hypothetical protein
LLAAAMMRSRVLVSGRAMAEMYTDQ